MRSRLKPLARVGAAAAAAAGLIAISSASAYNVAPLRLRLEPVGAGATGRIEVRNTEARPITLSVEANAVSVTDAGATQSRPEAEDIIIFPPQLVLQPGQSQAIQVRYVGDPQLAQARLYSARITQEPIDMNTGAQAQLKMGVDFVAAIVVAPRDAQGEVTVDAFRVEPATRRVAVDMRNTGNGPLRIDNVVWSFRDASGAARPVAGKPTDFGETSLVLPGGRRTLYLPLGGDAGAVAGVSAALEES